MPAPTANAYTAPTPTTPIASSGPWIPSPLLPPLALAAKSIIGAGHSAWWQSVAALASNPAYSHPLPQPSALFCVRQFLLSCRTLLPPGVEAAGCARKDVTHRHVLPPFPPGWMARHRLVQNTHPRPNSYTVSLHPELPRSLPSHASLIVLATRLNFHVDGWAAGPCETLTAVFLDSPANTASQSGS